MTTTVAPRAFHIMTKPIGAICNLDCKYCFYLEKEKLYPENKDLNSFRMTDAVLENYVRQYIAQQDVPEITFAWQGGEPTLMGLEFFQRVVELQARYCPPGRRIANAMQTNGVLLDDAWCEFLHRHNFLIGLSVDGPKEIHDRYRVNKAGHGTFDAVMRGLEKLKAHRVEFNTLTVVNRQVAQHPMEVYEFLKSIGSQFMQFIPLVERIGAMDTPGPATPGPGAPGTPGVSGAPGSHGLAAPPLLKVLEPSARVTPWSVEPVQFGDFLCTIFDSWVRHDVGRYFVQIFDVQLGIEVGAGSSLCVFAETCGRAMALEHNGDLYSCDHYVYPQFKLGNIQKQTIEEMVESEAQRRFGTDKRDALPAYCRRCEVREHCNGECPKHRFLTTPDGEPGLNYLCAGYKKFFTHIQPELRMMADLLRQERPPALIMDILARREGRTPAPPDGVAAPAPTGVSAAGVGARGAPGRNDPCPCGSGQKFKKCCGK